MDKANSRPEHLGPKKVFSKKAFPVGVHNGSHASARPSELSTLPPPLAVASASAGASLWTCCWESEILDWCPCRVSTWPHCSVTWSHTSLEVAAKVLFRWNGPVNLSPWNTVFLLHHVERLVQRDEGHPLREKTEVLKGEGILPPGWPPWLSSLLTYGFRTCRPPPMGEPIPPGKPLQASLLSLFSRWVVSDSFTTPGTAARQAPLSTGFPRR